MKNSKVAIEVEIKNIKKIADLKKELKDLRKEQKESEKYAKTGKFTSKEQEKGYKDNAKAIKQKSKALRDYNKDLANSSKAAKSATKSSGSLTKSFLKTAGAITVVVGAFRTVSAAISRTIATFTEFEFTMAKVQAVSGATEEEFKALTKTAEELGRTTFFTAEQVGQLQLAYSKLGFTATEIQDAVKPTLDLATATGTDLARAAQVAGAAVRGFGLDASETERVVDVMAVSFSSSAMDIEKWQTGMTKVAPIAKAAGFSIEDTAAIMSKLSDSGIEASIAGTSLRNILLKMQDPSSDLSKSFGSTIHSLDDLVPAMKKFVSEGGSMADIMEVVDLRQAAAFEQMLTTADGTLALRNELESANGEGARMAEIVGDTLQGAFLKLKSALQGVSISVMKDFAGGMQKGVETAASFFNVLAENSKTITTTIKFLGKLIRVVGLYKLGVLAAQKGTLALKAVKALWIKTNTRLTASTITLTGSIKVLKAGIKSLLGSTGIGLLVAFLPEILNFLGLWGDKTDDLAESTDNLSEAEQRLLETEKERDEILKKTLGSTQKTQMQFEQLIELKEEMNRLTNKEGELLDDSATGQKTYNKLKGQAALLLKDLNKELKANDQELIDEATSIDDLTIAMENLTKAMMQQSIAEGFKRTMESITDEAATARVALMELKREMGKIFTTDEWNNMTEIQKSLVPGAWQSQSVDAYGMITQGSWMPPEDSEFYRYPTNEELYGAIQSDREDTQYYAPQNKMNPSEDMNPQFTQQMQVLNSKSEDAHKKIIRDILKGYKLWDEKLSEQENILNAIAVDDDLKKKMEESTLLWEDVASEYGLPSVLTTSKKTGGTKDKDKPDPIVVTNWEEETKKAILAVKQEYSDATKSQEQYQIALAKTRKDMLQAELNEILLIAEDKRNLGQKKRKLDLETQIADAIIAENQNTFKRQMEIEQEKFNKIKQNIIEENTVRGKLTNDGQALILEQEALFLNTKLNLYNSYGQKVIGIDTSISKNKQAQHDLQMKMFKDQLSSMNNLGSGLQSLAGDNEKLNKVKEAGVVISKIATGIQKALAIQEQLVELGLIKKIALKKTDILLTNTQTGANLGEAASENISTGSILANTIATVASIIPKAISTVLKAASSGGPFGIIAAIAMFAFVKKLMKWKGEFGGVVPSDDKYARGGMVHGKLHSQGGEKFSAGGRVVELEGGEAVINRKSTAMFRSQLSAMNEAGGGVKFADGGLLNSPQFTQSQFDSENRTKLINAVGSSKKVYVVESDITTSQDTVSVIQANATF